MSFKAFLQADLIKNLATFSEGELMEAAALLRALSLLGPFPDLVNTEDEDEVEIEYHLDREIDGYIGRAAGYGEEWLILFDYSPYNRTIRIKNLARYNGADLNNFVEAEEWDMADTIALEIWLTSLTPALQAQIESLHLCLTAPDVARRNLIAARVRALDEAKTLFNFSSASLLSFETRWDFLLDLLRKELGGNVELTLCARFPDGTLVEAQGFKALGRLGQN